MDNYIGLSNIEAEKSRIEYGTNIISEKEAMTFWEKFWMNFKNPIITILLVALGINIFFTVLGKVDWFECVGIFISVMISTFVSTLSEYKNESTFKQLRDEVSDVKCKVYRDNTLLELHISDIVKNDVVLLQAGDIIPADGHIISGRIMVDQSYLNGEAKEVEKNGNGFSEDRIKEFWDDFSIYRGSVVCEGQSLMVVDEIGDNTIYGKISIETQEEEQKSPLNLKLAKLARDISKFGYIGASLIFIMFMFQKIFVDNSFSLVGIESYLSNLPLFFSDLVEAIIMCVTILVVAVPDGLPLMIAIVCSLNMKKMLKDNVLVRKIMGIETSGGINILFTDKTGTLTMGNLSLKSFIDGENIMYDSINELPEEIGKLAYISIVYNSGAILSENGVIGGNATEKALSKHVMDIKKYNFKIQKVNEVPFSSKSKFSMCEVRGDYNLTLIKGAPEKILPVCKRYLSKDGTIKKFNGEYVHRRIEEAAKSSERMLVFAYSENNMMDNLIFLTAVSIKDEIRKNVKESVAEVRRAGVRVVMITGDKKETAVSIAKECGILCSDKDIVLTSEELYKMTDDEIAKILDKVCVVSRAVPSDKSRLVKIAQRCGMVVGMTGDGVNDAPALKSADVGFAMGSGTDIAKASGDIVIMDDNFTSIRNSVLYGRTIYKSIKKFVTFQLTINISAVLISVFSFLFGVIKPLSITQMLWLNLLMDTLAAIAFGGEAALRKYMLEKPVGKNAPILDKKIWNSIFINSGYISLMSILFFLSHKLSSMFSQENYYTAYFTLFVFMSIFNAFNTRADGIDIFENISANKRFIFVMIAISFIQIIMTYFGGDVLRTNGLMFNEWLIVLFIAVFIIPVDILRKLIMK